MCLGDVVKPTSEERPVDFAELQDMLEILLESEGATLRRRRVAGSGNTASPEVRGMAFSLVYKVSRVLKQLDTRGVQKNILFQAMELFDATAATQVDAEREPVRSALIHAVVATMICVKMNEQTGSDWAKELIELLLNEVNTSVGKRGHAKGASLSDVTLREVQLLRAHARDIRPPHAQMFLSIMFERLKAFDERARGKSTVSGSRSFAVEWDSPFSRKLSEEMMCRMRTSAYHPPSFLAAGIFAFTLIAKNGDRLAEALRPRCLDLALDASWIRLCRTLAQGLISLVTKEASVDVFGPPGVAQALTFNCEGDPNSLVTALQELTGFALPQLQGGTVTVVRAMMGLPL